MKNSNENTKKEIPNLTHQESNQLALTKTRTAVEKTPPSNTSNNFFGILRRLVCSPNANLSDDRSEIVFIPKTSPK